MTYSGNNRTSFEIIGYFFQANIFQSFKNFSTSNIALFSVYILELNPIKPGNSWQTLDKFKKFCNNFAKLLRFVVFSFISGLG